MSTGTDPGCETCWKREDCPLAVLGHFCPQWQSREPEPREPDPNEEWRKGGEVPW